MSTIDKRKYHIKYRFVHSATLEMVKSIHVASDPEHHIFCDDWVKSISGRLSKKLESELRFFADRYRQWNFVMDLVAELAYYRSDANDLEPILEKIEKMGPVTFSVFFLGMSACGAEPELIKSFIAQPDTAASSKLKGGAATLRDEDIQYFFFHIEEMRQRLCAAMRQYWMEIFQYEWESIDRYLQTVIKRGMSLMERHGPLNYICSFHEMIYVEKGRLIFDNEAGLSIRLEDIKEIVITPSVFAHPHLYGNIFKGKVNIALSMNYNAVRINDAVPSETLELMHILSDETRFRIIKALWRNAATTTEMAELLTLSKTTVSLHLKLMKDAGIVEIEKVNKFAYYKLRKDSFYTIQKTLLDSLDE